MLSALADEARTRVLQANGPCGCRFRGDYCRTGSGHTASPVPRLGRADDACDATGGGLQRVGRSANNLDKLICPLQAMAGAGKIATEEGYALVAFLSAGAFLVLRGR